MGTYLSRSSLFFKLNIKTSSVKSVLFILILFLLFAFLPDKTFATTYYSRASANWNVDSTWSTTSFLSATNTGTFPIAGDIVCIGGGFTVTVNVNSACSSIIAPNTSTAGILTFSGASSLTVSGNIAMGGTNAARDLTITFVNGSSITAGSLTLGGTFGQGIIDMTLGGTLSIGGAITIGAGSGTWTPGTGTVIFTANNTLPTSKFTTFNNLQINGGTTTTGVSITAIASLTIGTSGTFTTASTHAITATTITVNGTYNAGSTGIITGNMTVGASTGILALTTITSTLSGNFTNNNSVTGTSGRLNVSGSITNSGTISLSTGRITQTGSSDFTNSGSITFSGAGRIYFSGNFTNSGTFSLGSAQVRLVGTGVGPYNIDGFTTTGAVTVSSTTGTYIFAGNVSCAGISCKGSGGTLNLGTGLTHTSSAIVAISAGAALNGGSSILKINVTGAAFTNAGTFTPSTGMINYCFAGTQTALATTYYKLTLSGTSLKTTAGITVNDTLSMEGTATASAVPTYGAGATLQYKTTDNRNVGVEWKTPFTATGGVLIDISSATITLNAGRTIGNGCKLNLKSGILAAGANLTMTSTSTINRSEGSMTGTPAGAGIYNVNYSGNTKTTGTELAGSGLNNITETLASGQILTLDANHAPDGDVTINSGSTFDLATFTLNRSAAGGILTVAGTILLGNTTGGQTGSNFPANFSTLTMTGGTVNYNSATGGQTVYSTPTYDTLIIGNTSGTQTAGGNLTVTTLNNNFNSADTLDMITYTLSVAKVNNTGTIKTQNSSAGGLSMGLSWGGSVEYNATGTQTIVAGTYNNLTISGAGNNSKTTGADITVNGILNLSAANFSSSQGCLEMGTDTLTMGATATTTGTGDVTGIVKRSTFVDGTPYSFGNQFTTMTFAAGGTPPGFVKFKITLNSALPDKSTSVLRIYDIIRLGGSAKTVTLQLHYLDTELQANTEPNLVIWDDEPLIPKAEEHGKANEDGTYIDNWVAISNRNITYFATAFDTHLWGLSKKESPDFIWLGAASTDWNDINNWTGGVVPIVTSDVVIPNTDSTVFDPILPAATSVRKITIRSNGVINGGTGTTLTIAGSTGAWINQGGTLNPGTSTILFTNTGSTTSGNSATMAGTTNFHNVTIDTNSRLKPQVGSIMRIDGTLTNNGKYDAEDLVNTVEYNGADQTVLNPNGGSPGYHHLIFSGSGTKTLPGAVLPMNLTGDFINNVTFAHNGGKIVFKGTGAQTINSGGNSFNNFSITNTLGTCTASTYGITVLDTFSTRANTTLDMATFALSVNTVIDTCTLKTQNTGATPITAAKTWGGTVEYNGTAGQTIVKGNYNNLTISGNKSAGVITFVNGDTIGVAAAFTASATNASYTVTGNIFDYNGSGAQNITPNTAPFSAYNNLVISNSGVKTIATAVTCLTYTEKNVATLEISGIDTLHVTQ